MAVLSMLSHPNIVQMYATLTDMVEAPAGGAWGGVQGWRRAAGPCPSCEAGHCGGRGVRAPRLTGHAPAPAAPQTRCRCRRCCRRPRRARRRRRRAACATATSCRTSSYPTALTPSTSWSWRWGGGRGGKGGWGVPDGELPTVNILVTEVWRVWEGMGGDGRPRLCARRPLEQPARAAGPGLCLHPAAPSLKQSHPKHPPPPTVLRPRHAARCHEGRHLPPGHAQRRPRRQYERRRRRAAGRGLRSPVPPLDAARARRHQGAAHSAGVLTAPLTGAAGRGGGRQARGWAPPSTPIARRASPRIPCCRSPARSTTPDPTVPTPHPTPPHTTPITRWTT
jgi:hypothetical protein